MNQKRKTEAPQIPAFRFSGFSGEWTVGNLGKYAQIGTGTRDVQEATENGVYPFFIRSEEVKRINSYSFDGEAILIPGEGRLGEIFHYINGKFDYHQRVYKISDFKGLYGKFVLHYMRTHFKRHAMKYTVKATVDSLRLPTIKEFLIYYPAYAEQTQIGEFFQTIDRLIELQSEKVAQAERYKKAMLQKLFPQKGETIPKLRFAGFSGEWEKQALEKISERFDNLRVPVSASDRIPGDTPYYGANGIQDYVEGYTHDGEFILIAEDGANDLLNYPVRYVTGKIWVNNHAHVLSAKKNKADNRFLSYSLKTINMAPYLVGGSRAKLNASTMMKILLKLPSFEEQTQIGNFFQILDKRIEAEGQKLERYQTLKRAMLQRMFV